MGDWRDDEMVSELSSASVVPLVSGHFMKVRHSGDGHLPVFSATTTQIELLYENRMGTRNHNAIAEKLVNIETPSPSLARVLEAVLAPLQHEDFARILAMTLDDGDGDGDGGGNGDGHGDEDDDGDGENDVDGEIQQWLLKLWEYFNEHRFPLELVLKLPIVPLQSRNDDHHHHHHHPHCRVGALQDHLLVANTLPKHVLGAFLSLGLPCISLEFPIHQHPDLAKFVELCTPTGISNVLHHHLHPHPLPHPRLLSQEECDALCTFFAQHYDHEDIPVATVDILRQFEIYRITPAPTPSPSPSQSLSPPQMMAQYVCHPQQYLIAPRGILHELPVLIASVGKGRFLDIPYNDGLGDGHVNFLLKLGAREVDAAEFYMDFVLSHHHSLEPSLRNRAFLYCLQHLPTILSAHPHFLAALAECPFVPVSQAHTDGDGDGGGDGDGDGNGDGDGDGDGDRDGRCLRAPNTLYDPSVRQLLEILSPCCFPGIPFNSVEVLVSLRSLGLRHSLTISSIIHRVQQLEMEQNVEASSRLLRYLDEQSATLLSLHGDGDGGGDGDGDAVRQALKTRAWIPTLSRAQAQAHAFTHSLSESHLHPHHHRMYVPWPQGAVPRLAAATDMRPLSEVWLVSSTRYLSAYEVRSQELLQALGWHKPIAVSVLAKQLLHLAKLSYEAPEMGMGVGVGDDTYTSFQQHLASLIPRIYELISEAVKLDYETSGAVIAAVQKEWSSREWLWNGDGFLGVRNVAFSSAINVSALHLHTVSPELLPFRPLFTTLGVCPP